MRLEKYQALGNDFLIVLDLDGSQPVEPSVARALCDRHRGVGADGLIRVTAGGSGTGGPGDGASEEAVAGPDVAMELWNADGGRAETSGNGLRCLARAVLDAGVVAGPELTVATDAGVRRARAHSGGMITVEMGVATTASYATGPRPELRVDLGNPHLVIEVEDPAKLDLSEEAASFLGTNVEFIARGPGPGELTMRVWERGVGETQSCGSGACAAAVAASAWRMVGHRVTVHQPGGDLLVEIAVDGALTLTGPAEHVFTAEVPRARAAESGEARARAAESGDACLS